MQKFLLQLDAPINGIYLSSETIELLSMIQCKDMDELREFARNCSQLNISEQDIASWNESKLEETKRSLVEQYKDTLMPMEQSIKDRRSVIQSALEHSGIASEEVDSYILEFQKNGYEGVKQRLQTEHPESYAVYAEKAHRFIGTERDQMKSVSYEELSRINDTLHSHNTILIASGRYYDVTNKFYNEQMPDMQKYDFYYPQRGLDFCHQNGMHARYHTLLDKQTMEEHLVGKPKEEVLAELKGYVRQSIDFISKYNDEHKVEKDGKGVITSVDLFNEIISFDPQYRNMWQELHGVSTEELADVFQYALEHKPEGVTYVYNEPFLENPDRREVVIEQLEEINEVAKQKYGKPLIDTLGTQMHIEMSQSKDDIRKCFEDFKALQEKTGIGIQITEFDMCLPERFMFDENGKARAEREIVELINSRSNAKIKSIAEIKTMKIKEIEDTIAETGVQLEGITYWSVSDTLDHNLQRTNRETIEQNLNRDIAQTRYAGLYSDIETKKETKLERLNTEQGILAETFANRKREYEQVKGQTRGKDAYEQSK